ncbi:hypothetical protein BC828DRAFT_391580 [Blastocladiella britannica]|nr:hypothetical protein BC828DRAFT_391580 [Blastocladiella britannica]
MASQLNEAVVNVRESIPDVRAALAPLLSVPLDPNAPTLDETLASISDPVDRAKLLVALAFALQSSLHAHLKVSGQDTNQDHIRAQLDRLKVYFGKVKQAEDRKNRASTVDVEAAGRFIRAAGVGSSSSSAATAGRAPAQPASSAGTSAPSSKPRYTDRGRGGSGGGASTGYGSQQQQPRSSSRR